jgi:hypothetical protein
MLHPDYQYSPRLVPAMAAMVASGEYDFVLGSRILGNGALAGGMPVYKYVANRVLTLLQNWLIGQKMSEYHTGFRCWSRRALEMVPYDRCSDDFVFDNQMVCQAAYFGLRGGGRNILPHKVFPRSVLDQLWPQRGLRDWGSKNCRFVQAHQTGSPRRPLVQRCRVSQSKWVAIWAVAAAMFGLPMPM